MAVGRLVWFAVGLGLLLGGCGGDQMSLTEYVEHLNAIEAQASEQAEAILAQAAQVGDDLTPQDVQAGLERARAIRIDVEQAAERIEPPEQVADLHDLIFDWHARFISVEEALAARAGLARDTAADWAALSESAEMIAYRAAMAEGKQICLDFQADLDATEERGVFAESPWVPGEMAEVVEAVLGCAWFPEHPEDVYRYPATGSGT